MSCLHMKLRLFDSACSSSPPEEKYVRRNTSDSIKKSSSAALHRGSCGSQREQHSRYFNSTVLVKLGEDAFLSQSPMFTKRKRIKIKDAPTTGQYRSQCGTCSFMGISFCKLVAPQEDHEPNSGENVRLQKTVTGTVHKQVGESNFYSKHGIKPIPDTLDHSAVSSLDPESPIKMKNVRKLHDGSTKFPKLAECAHFHYDFTELAAVVVSICDDNQENFHHQAEPPPGDLVFYLTVFSNDRSWVIRRTHLDFRTFDKQLHKCIFDRKFSLLPDLRRREKEIGQDGLTSVRKMLNLYLRRFSSIAGNMINCGPILSWLEMDNRGNRLMVTDDSEINTPAISAGHVIKRYNGQAPDELTIQVGDIISIIDMPPGEETAWWRGKNHYQVGFFPCECVELISDKSIPQSMEGMFPDAPPTKPVLRKRGKLISFLRAFFTSRPARTQLQRTGIVKQRIFGCDLGEHLSNLGLEVPKVLTSCAIVIEEHGIVDGIYRLSGVASNIQKLRNDFDDEKEPCLTDEIYLQDIHSISSLLKAYFRELPNPLLTYQLYEKFSEAVSLEEHKLLKIHDVIQQLPPPHYRTAEYLFKHLNRVSKFGKQTGMHCKNLAIVWAPNLMRSKDLETMCNTAMLQGVGVQAIVTEFLIQYADLIFSDKLQNVPNDSGGSIGRRQRPKSLAISTPTKLLSLEEAREQMLAGPSNESPKQKYIEVGGGPSNLPKEFHTVIDIPNKKKSRKDRRSPALTRENSAQPGTGWKSIFSRKKQDSVKSTSEARVSTQISETEVTQHRKLRTVRSADSLISSSNSEPRGKSKTSGKLGKEEDFPAVRPKALYQDFKKNQHGRRTMSHDLAHSESDLSDPEAMVVTMEAEMVQRPASATAELTGGQRGPEFASEVEYTLSVKTKPKKGKMGKEMKKSKKKQRSASAGQPIEGVIPGATEVNLHSRSKSTSHTDPAAHYHTASEPPGSVGHPPPPSPSFKERLVQALTPTSPRKRIKGPAPSPPQSPPATLPEAGVKTKKKSGSGKSKSLPKNLPTFEQVQKHSKPEVVAETRTDLQTTGGVAASNIQSQQPGHQLSPIEEALQSDMSSTPDVEPQLLAARLQQSHLQTWSRSEYDGAEGDSISFGNITDEDVFQQQDNPEPPLHRPTVARYDQLELAHSGSNHYRPHSEQKSLQEHYNDGGNARNGVRSTADDNLSNTEMSMSLDSLLKEVVGSENYHSEFGSSTSFRTFGKTSDSPAPPESSSQDVMPTAQEQPPPLPPHRERDGQSYRRDEYGGHHPTESHRTEEYATQVDNSPLSESQHYEVGEAFTTEKNPAQYTSFSQHSAEEEAELPNMIDMDQRSLTTTTSHVLETDLDSCDVSAETPEEFLAPEEKVTVHREAVFPHEEDVGTDESRHYIAPLPGDIRMMSHYPDLIPHNIMAQIDLQEADVQYVDPRQNDAQQHQYQYVPDVSLEAESKMASADFEHRFSMTPQTDADHHRTTFYSEPEPMVTADRSYNKSQVTDNPMLATDPFQQQPPDVASSFLPEDDENDPFGLKSERGQIVIRKPVDHSPEGSTFIPVKTRVVPPPRQFAYSAPPTAPEEMGTSTNNEVQPDVLHHDGETAIDTPSDEFPSPPPSISEDTDGLQMSTEGYLADRSGSASPTNTQEARENFQVKLKAASQPVAIEEEDNAMVISPTCSMSKTPESDNAMVTSSVESDNVLEDYRRQPDHEYHSLYSREIDENSSRGHTTQDVLETMESELVFQMDDVVKSKSSSLSKSVDSLQNLSMSSGEDREHTLQEGLDLVILESQEVRDGEEREYAIEDTQSQVGYYFTYDEKTPEDDDQSKSTEAFTQVLGRFSNISSEALVSTITVEDVAEQRVGEEKPDPSQKTNYDYNTINEDEKPKMSRSVYGRLQSQFELSQTAETEKKATPVRRKKSVKELLSKFEVASESSPPSDHEVEKSKPQVFQKPRVVRLHSLNKSSDIEDTPDADISKSPKKDDTYLMSVSCPDASRLLSLSPRSIDFEEERSTPVTTLNKSTTDHVKPKEPPAVSKKPSIRNKIQHFQSSESLTSDSEQPIKAVSPGRMTNREESPVHQVTKERAFSPVPPAKPVIIHERTSPKQVADTKPRDTPSLKKDSIQATLSKEDSNYSSTQPQKSLTLSLNEGSKHSFPPSQKSQSSPKFSRRTPERGSSSEGRTTASFQLRSANSGMSNSLLKVSKPATPQDDSSEKKLQSLTERMKRFQSTSEEESSNASCDTVNNESTNSMEKGFTPRASGMYHNRRASVEAKLMESSTMSVHSNNTPMDHHQDSNVSITSQDYARSASVPSAFDGRHASSSALSYKTTPSAGDSGFAMDTNEESPGLKPSQLFSRKAKHSDDSPAVSQSLGSRDTTAELGSKNTSSEDANIMKTSFSDRRKLFEGSTDSGISSSGSGGSLKRNDVSVKPKQTPVMNAPRRKDSSNNVVHQEIHPSSVKQVRDITTPVLSPDTPRHPTGTTTDYTNKIRQFGNKTVVIESTETNGKSGSTSSHKLSTSGAAVGNNGNLGNGRAKPYERDQKENVKPAAAAFNSFEKKDNNNGSGNMTQQKERSGTVKDLWRKFEQQNT